MEVTGIASERPEAELQPAGAGETRVRVLHVISGLGPGGAEGVLYRLISNARTAQHEVISLGPREWYSDKLEEAGIRVQHVDLGSAVAAIPGTFRLYQIIRASNAQVVQGWMYRGSVFGGLASRIAGKRVMWNLRCSDIHMHSTATRALVRLGGLLARWVPSAILNCSSVSRRQHEQIGYGAAAGMVVPNGYDPDLFYPDEKAREATRKSVAADPRTFVVGTIGRWDWTKAYPSLLQAVALVAKRGIPLRLLLVGRGLDRDNDLLQAAIGENSCGEIVELLGHRPDVADVARALDIHVLASVTEGFPNVIAETMLSGTPNVCTDVGDSRLIVDDTGWIVPPGSPEQLADAIEQAYIEWSESPRQWADRRNAARERIKDHFSLRQMVRTYENLWRQVAEDGVISGSAS